MWPLRQALEAILKPLGHWHSGQVYWCWGCHSWCGCFSGRYWNSVWQLHQNPRKPWGKEDTEGPHSRMSLKTWKASVVLAQPSHFEASKEWNVREDKLRFHLQKHQKINNIKMQAGYGRLQCAYISNSALIGPRGLLKLTRLYLP